MICLDVIVGVPGAFTPPCSSQVPGYVEHADAFASKGVSGIYIVGVNDAFTMQAWKEKLGAKHSIVHFLADDTGAVSTPTYTLPYIGGVCADLG